MVKIKAEEIKTFSPLTYRLVANRLRDYAARSGSDSDLSQLAAYLSAWITKSVKDLKRGVGNSELSTILHSAISCLKGAGGCTDANSQTRLADRHCRLFFSDPEDWTRETVILNLLTMSTVIGLKFNNYLRQEFAGEIQAIARGDNFLEELD